MCELARVTIEVGAKDGIELAECRVATIFVEQVLGKERKLSLVAKEALERRR